MVLTRTLSPFKPIPFKTNHAWCVSKMQPDAIIVYDFEDTDVWMISSYLCHQSQQQSFMYKSQTDNHPLYYSCKSLFGNMQIASAALGVYVFIGVDTVEAFLGCGKVSVWNRLLKQSDKSLMTVMHELGSESHLSDVLVEKLERFTIKVVYNDPVSRQLSQSRAHKWRKSITVNSAKLPPDADSLTQHCYRAHIQLYEWRHATEGKRLCPTDFGWKKVNGVLQPNLSTMPALPESINMTNVSLVGSDGDDDDDISGESIDSDET